MRPWRDIFSKTAWEKIVLNENAHVPNQSAISSQNLLAVTQLVGEYHAIPKTVLNRLNDRIAKLKLIHTAAGTVLSQFNVDEKKAKERVGWSSGNYVPLSKDKATGRWDSARHTFQSLERNLLTLKNRSARKATYVDQLNQYYGTNSLSPKHLIDILSAPNPKNPVAISLTPGVRLESLDPWHRTVELELENINKPLDEDDPEVSMEKSYARWYQTLNRHNTPFFLWLEGDEYCTADDKGLVYHNASVTYVDNKTGFDAVPQRFKVCMVFEHAGKLWMDEMKSGWLAQRVASTSGYECDAETKGVSGAAAYIWTGQEIMMAQHSPSNFHHSSFNGGSPVQCAGMIKIDNGMISYVSNNSGHYKPTKEHLYRFTSTLSLRGVVRFDCVVHCFGVKPNYQNLATHFLANYQKL